MRKIVLLVLVCLLGVSPLVSARESGFAIGAEFALTDLNGYGAMLTLVVPKVPLYFGIGASIQSTYLSVAVNADYWFTHGHLVSLLDYYIGLGLTTGITLGESASFSLGARLPLGLQIWPLGKVLEVFVEIAPAWVPVANGINLAHFQVQSALGFRIWI